MNLTDIQNSKHNILCLRFVVARDYKMALFRTGVFTLRALRPKVINSNNLIPASVNIQVRYAARKGYREKAKKKKQAIKLQNVAVKQDFKIRKKVVKYEKTVENDKPDPPNDDIIIINDFKQMKYSLSEAIKFHREYHHPTVFDNPEAPITIRAELSMVGKKDTQTLKPFSGVAAIPHPISGRTKKHILVICEPEDAPQAEKWGATTAGGAELIKKIQGGVIQPILYEYILCHVSMVQQMNPLRGLLKNQLPKIRAGTITPDLKTAIDRFLNGVEYSTVVVESEKNFAVIECQIGSIDMETEKIEENFKAVLEDILKHKPRPDSNLITWIWCLSPPSREMFSIDLSRYIKLEKVDDIEEDDDEQELTPEQKERLELKKLRQEMAEKSVIGE